MPQIADHIRKIAVTYDNHTAQFIHFDQTKPLDDILKEVASSWNIADIQDIALQFEDLHKFLTEKNRFEIKNGTVLKLSPCARILADRTLDQLNSKNKVDVSTGLGILATLAIDETFAKEFIEKQGLVKVMEMIKADTCKGDDLGRLLKAFFDLIDQGIVTWEIIEQDLINMVASYCTGSKTTLVPLVLQASLEILEDIISNGEEEVSNIVEQDVTPVSILNHLQSTDEGVQKNAIALINALITQASPEKQKKYMEELRVKGMRKTVLEFVIRKNPGVSVGPQMAHQLYVLQCHLINVHNEARQTPVDPNSPDSTKEMSTLCLVAFEAEADSVRRKGNLSDIYRKLGFDNPSNPLLDFVKVPPGKLAIKLLVHFSQMHQDDFSKIVLENSCRADEHDLPFGRTAIELAKMLCDILHIGDPPNDEGVLYEPMFFTHDYPFEELFCTCIGLYNTTWKDMRATIADFPKVTGVVREQISRALDMQPTSFEQFKQKLAALKYVEILNLWQQERRNKEESEAVAKPIQELRAQIRPQIELLIRQQRLNYLVEGSHFAKPGKRKEKFTFVRLSTNHKVICYGDCGENDFPSADQLSNKLNVSDIRTIVIGKDCPHVKDSKDSKKKVGNIQHAMSIIPEQNISEPLNLIAQNDEMFNIWADGLHTLLNQQMTSSLVSSDINMLLNMEIKLRLLDVEGISIPENPPVIPPDPPNLDFVYKV